MTLDAIKSIIKGATKVASVLAFEFYLSVFIELATCDIKRDIKSKNSRQYLDIKP